MTEEGSLMPETKDTGRHVEDEVAGWLALSVCDQLVAVGKVYLKGREYAVEYADEDDEMFRLESPLVLTRTGDGRRFEVEVEVDAVELPAATSGLPDNGKEHRAAWQEREGGQ
jgi:hypothetical protein